MTRVLIIGATSAIAEATARRYAVRGAALFLVGRRLQRLETIAQDLRVRGAARVDAYAMDANDVSAHEPMLERAAACLGGMDVVLIAYGTLSDQQACEGSAAQTVRELMNNAVSVAALLVPLAQRLEAQRSGTIVVISSVAGDRGRRSNYVYGSAKAMLSAFVSGLRQRLYPAGVAVITVKPGFVDTPMTAALRKGVLWAKPDQVARGIVRAIERSTPVVYLPAFWRPVMALIRAVPERLFRRLAF